MKWPTETAMELIWPGVPVTACASMRPWRSKTPAERSPHSRTIGLKAVRSRVCACSSTMAIRRFHMSCLRSSGEAGRVRHARLHFASSRQLLRSRTMQPLRVEQALKRRVTKVVVSSSVMIAGPAMLAPGESSARAIDSGPPIGRPARDRRRDAAGLACVRRNVRRGVPLGSRATSGAECSASRS